MMLLARSVIITVFLCFTSIALWGQLGLDAVFAQKLQQAGVDFIYPVESDYKTRKIPRNAFQKYDFAIASRKEKLEIRYLVDIPNPNSPLSWAPHVRSTQMITHLATNDEEGIITVQRIPEDQLEGDFNADWGKVYFFQPKPSFSNKKHCRMLSLFREDRATVFVFFLFDDIEPALDHRFYAVRFEDSETIK